jgi:hypothetical protein
MKKTIAEYAKWACFSILLCVGGFAFMVLLGDENPTSPMPFSRWMLLKATAGVILYLCVRVGRWLHMAGRLPGYLDRITEEEA